MAYHNLTQEQIFRLLAENTTDMITLHAVDTRVLYISPACMRILGYKAEELEGCLPFDWLHPEDTAQILKQFKPGLVRGVPVQSFDVRLRHRDGHYVWLEASIQPVMDGKFASEFVVVSRDITERKKADDALHASMAYNQALLRAIPDMLFVMDEKGVFLDFRAEGLHNLYTSPENFIGKPVNEVLPLAVAEKVYTAIDRAISSGEIQEFDYQLLAPGAAVLSTYEVRLMFAGEDRVLALVRDITSRKRSEEELREAQAQLAQRVKELEQRTGQISLLTEISNMLQTSITLEEAHAVIGQFGNRLFPGTSGVMMTTQFAPGAMEVVSCWGDLAQSGIRYNRDDCWGLRRGRPFISLQTDNGLQCPHVDSKQLAKVGSYFCVPIMAQGETIGLLHIQYPIGLDQAIGAHLGQNYRQNIESQLQIAEAFTEQLGLALSNLQLREKLHEQAIHEPLTGLFNRYYMEESLERELFRAMRNNRPVAIILMDLDHFKEFNTEFGHPNVDQMLREFGSLLRSSVRGGDIACRYGGDEFLVIMPDINLEIAVRRAEQLRRQMSALAVRGEGLEPHTVTISVGVALWPYHGSNAAEVIQAADQALFSAKNQGGDCVVVATLPEGSGDNTEHNRNIIDQSDNPGLIGDESGKFKTG